MDQSLTTTNTLHPNDEKVNYPQPEYSEAMKVWINFKRQRLIAARDARDTPCQEHDDMPFLKWYDVMKKADDQYVAPRKNPQDTAVNIGTIRDKDSTLLEFAQKYDFEPVAECFDEDAEEMLGEMAETMEDMVAKSFKLEQYKDKSKLITRSMIAFGTALVEDAYVETWGKEKKITGNIGSDTAKWTDKIIKTYEGCEAKLWDLRKCYFGNIRRFFMNGTQGQPYFFTAEYVSYDDAKAMFSKWDKWKYVPTTVVTTSEISNISDWTQSWTLRPITQNSVEVIRYYDPIANEFSITLNGVEMLPIMENKTTQDGVEKTMISGFPLTAISPSGTIPFAKFDLEPMHDFAYSKPQPAKMRVLGDIQNMMFKIMLRMFKQKADPTMGNKSGRTFDFSVSEPATVINDIRDGDLFPVLPNFRGPESSDFSMFDLVAKELSRNSVQDSFQGIDNSDQSKQTATANMNEMKAQSLSVAAMFDGIISGIIQLSWLRTYNIVQNWTKPVDKRIDVQRKVIENVYKTISMDTEMEGGVKGTKKVIMTTDTPKGKPTLDDSVKIHQDEMDHEKETGRKVQHVYLNPVVLKSLRLSWYYSCTPVPNDSDPLSYVMFAKQVMDAQAMFGPESLNVKKLKRRFALKTGNDFDTFFLNENDLEQAKQEAAVTAAQNGEDPKKTNPTMGGLAQGANPMAKMGAVMK